MSSAEGRIFGEAAASGILAGIAIKKGIEVDEASISIMVLKSICQATQSIQSSFNCWNYVVLLSILAVVLSIFAVVETISNADNLKVGILIYLVGFASGLFLILIFA